MSNIQVNSISSVNGSDPVNFPTGLSGNASTLTFEPRVLQFSPLPLSTNVGVSTDIVITFNQKIQFSGVGTIFIRESSATGSITTSFTCGVSAGATIVGETLIINPTSNLSVGTTYYVTLPSVGIANTFGQFYKGTESYFFQTESQIFSIEGGAYVYNAPSPTSPTGWYRYHIFSASGPLVLNSPSTQATDLQFMLVGGGGRGGGPQPAPTGNGLGGGGGAGGLIARTGPTLGLSAGTYAITIGSAGPTGGNDSKLSGPPTVDILTAFAGGNGGGGAPSPYAGRPGGSGGGGHYYPSGTGLSGGLGTPGQGNSGGQSYTVSVAPPPGFPATTPSSFSGGGGGAGAAAPSGGNGGNGSPNPAFSVTFLSGYIPAPVLPISSLNAIGPSGFYAGGGAGSGGGPNRGRSGGSGGGGSTAPYGISPITPDLRVGQILTGGGGGTDQSGGPGVAMIRYAVPAPQ